MNDFVASSVCWTIDTSSRTSPPARAGSVATSRSTICAWSTMFVRLWAGPSCIARAISRRRSSCELSSSRATSGGRPPNCEPSIPGAAAGAPLSGSSFDASTYPASASR